MVPQLSITYGELTLWHKIDEIRQTIVVILFTSWNTHDNQKYDIEHIGINNLSLS